MLAVRAFEPTASLKQACLWMYAHLPRHPFCSVISSTAAAPSPRYGYLLFLEAVKGSGVYFTSNKRKPSSTCGDDVKVGHWKDIKKAVALWAAWRAVSLDGTPVA
jgi:hypothetical protein